ncbi:MAG: carbon monoxide dehydrogenase subunit G [Rhodospirillales bacterium]|nr:carbon monoxide dehydrogenase subunit G [Rhodospirillales bacterium]
MNLTGEYIIAASRLDVWAALNDPEVLKVCVPGCDEMEKVSDTQFTAKVTMKVGAVKARLKGNVELSDIDAPNSYSISGQGQGGVAGFAKGGAKVSLVDAKDGGTVLHYEATAELGGKLAAVGSRVIQGIAKKMADDFFGKFAAHLSGEAAEEVTPVAKHSLHAAPVVSDDTSTTNSRDLTNTGRDILWFIIGIAVGVAVTWAYYN